MHCTLVSVINERLSKADEYDVTLERPVSVNYSKVVDVPDLLICRSL